MVLAASDELRHPHDDTFNWRESLYFNFADKVNGFGGWIYLWVVPNKPLKSGMLVSVYKGVTDRLDANDVALTSAGHRFVGNQHNWVYCYKKDVEELISADFDDIALAGLHLVRKAPMQGYNISFSDEAGSSIRLDVDFPMLPYDYNDGLFETPAWVAKNRYHRSTKVNGKISIGGDTFRINATGDSDHSWGLRDMDEFSTHNFKMWSFQTPDARSAVSVIEQGSGLYLGFLNMDGDVRSVQHIQHASQYSRSGVQREIEIEVTDVAGRVVCARLPEMFSVIGHGEPAGLWGFEGVGCYEVENWGTCTGVASYFWPPAITPGKLHRGE